MTFVSNDLRRGERLSRLGLLEEPLGYVDGLTLYEFVNSNPINGLDPEGLLDKRTEANIAKLYSQLQPLARKHVEKLNEKLQADKKIAVIIQGLRTEQEQNRIPAQNTQARGLQSYHVWGLAYDIGIFKCDEKGNAKDYITNADDPGYDTAGAIGKELGLEWGGDWKRLVDKPHFQYPLKNFGIKDIQELIKKYQEKKKDPKFQAMTPPAFVETLPVKGPTSKPAG